MENVMFLSHYLLCSNPQLLSTNSSRKCTEISLENFYVDIPAQLQKRLFSWSTHGLLVTLMVKVPRWVTNLW